jgi:hypothetical protein
MSITKHLGGSEGKRDEITRRGEVPFLQITDVAKAKINKPLKSFSVNIEEIVCIIDLGYYLIITKTIT